MKFYWIFALAFIAVACKQKSDVLYTSDAFTVFADKVIQGNNEATVISPTKITSNYKSMESAEYSRLITFKFSINEKDNECPSRVDHWTIIGKIYKSLLDYIRVIKVQ